MFRRSDKETQVYTDTERQSSPPPLTQSLPVASGQRPATVGEEGAACSISGPNSSLLEISQVPRSTARLCVLHGQTPAP